MGPPQKQSFCGVKIPFNTFSYLSPYEGERDKGEGLVNNLQSYYCPDSERHV